MKSNLLLFAAFSVGLLVVTSLGCATNNQFSAIKLMKDAPTPVVSNSRTVANKEASVSLLTLSPGQDISSMISSSPGVVLIDFYADWCGPCRRQSTVLHDVARSSDQQGKIIKVNVDEHPELAKRYDVVSLPTLVAIKDGTVVEKKIGLTQADRIAKLLNN